MRDARRGPGRIDALDAELVALVARRAALVRDATRFKRDAAQGRRPGAPGRGLRPVCARSPSPIAAGFPGLPDVVEATWRTMVGAFVAREQALLEATVPTAATARTARTAPPRTTPENR